MKIIKKDIEKLSEIQQNKKITNEALKILGMKSSSSRSSSSSSSDSSYSSSGGSSW